MNITHTHTQVIREQEKRLIGAQSDVETSRSELRLAQKSAQESKMNEESARRDLEDALRQLKESREVLSENQRVITWLNRQLNDAKMEKENAAITRKSYIAAHDFSGVATEMIPPGSKAEETTKNTYDLGPPYEDILLGNDEEDDLYPLYDDEENNGTLPKTGSSSSHDRSKKMFDDLPTDSFGLSVRETLESSSEGLFSDGHLKRKPLGLSVDSTQNVPDSSTQGAAGM